MSFSDRIQDGLHNRENRKPYYDSRAFSHGCRNHGSCDYCRQNRTYNHTKRKQSSNDNLKDLDNSISIIDETYYSGTETHHMPYWDEADCNIDQEDIEKHIIK